MAKKAGATIRAKTRKKTARKSPVKNDDGSVTASMLAGVLSDKPFTDRWLRELSGQGYLVRVGRGRYDLKKSVQGYIRFIRETEVRGAQEGSSKELFEAERARKLKLENDKKEALLVATPDALAAVDAIFGQVRTALSGVPARLSDDPAERRRVENVIDTVLGEMSDRFDKAGADLREGRDPLADDNPINT